MAPASQPWGRYNGSGCRLHTHSVCTEAGKRVEWALGGGCAHVKGAEMQVQVQCKMPKVGHQAGCGVSRASATFGRC